MSENTIDITLYYANWCDHCVQFKPEWNKFKQMMEKTHDNINGFKIKCNEYEDTEIANSSKLSQENILGYPTIKIKVNTRNKQMNYEYNGKRTAKSLSQHVLNKIPENLVH